MSLFTLDVDRGIGLHNPNLELKFEFFCVRTLTLERSHAGSSQSSTTQAPKEMCMYKADYFLSVQAT